MLSRDRCEEIDKTRELDYTKVLEVELTDEEYQSYKRAALEIK